MIAEVHDSNFGADFKDKTVNNNDYNKRLKKYNYIPVSYTHLFNAISFNTLPEQ